MKAVEFETELSGGLQLDLPAQIAAQLPGKGRARIIVLVEDAEGEHEDTAWRKGAYERFMEDDSPEDSVYDKYA